MVKRSTAEVRPTNNIPQPVYFTWKSLVILSGIFAGPVLAGLIYFTTFKAETSSHIQSKEKHLMLGERDKLQTKSLAIKQHNYLHEHCQQEMNISIDKTVNAFKKDLLVIQFEQNKKLEKIVKEIRQTRRAVNNGYH